MRTLAGGTLLVHNRTEPCALADGWEMPYPGGRKILRSELQLQCSAIHPMDGVAVPELLKWLDHKDALCATSPLIHWRPSRVCTRHFIISAHRTSHSKAIAVGLTTRKDMEQLV